MLFAAVSCAGSDATASYQPFEKFILVTPEYLVEHTIPFHFSVTEAQPGLFSVIVTLGPDSEKSGTSSGCILIVTDDQLPDGRAAVMRWIMQAGRLSQQRKVVEIPVPTATRKVTSHMQLLKLPDLERAALCANYAQHGYGGDSYWVPLGRFIPKKASQSLEPTR